MSLERRVFTSHSLLLSIVSVIRCCPSGLLGSSLLSLLTSRCRILYFIEPSLHSQTREPVIRCNHEAVVCVVPSRCAAGLATVGFFETSRVLVGSLWGRQSWGNHINIFKEKQQLFLPLVSTWVKQTHLLIEKVTMQFVSGRTLKKLIPGWILSSLNEICPLKTMKLTLAAFSKWVKPSPPHPSSPLWLNHQPWRHKAHVATLSDITLRISERREKYRIHLVKVGQSAFCFMAQVEKIIIITKDKWQETIVLNVFRYEHSMWALKKDFFLILLMKLDFKAFNEGLIWAYISWCCPHIKIIKTNNHNKYVMMSMRSKHQWGNWLHWVYSNKWK